MKNTVRNFGIIFLIALYCHIAGATTINGQQRSPGLPSLPAAIDYAPVITLNLPGTFIQAESIFKLTNTTVCKTFKPSCPGSHLSLCMIESLFTKEVRPYIAFSRYLLLSFRKPDIVFPFHSFL
ncbi:MAG: hypothetical protein IH596_04255 [Bacteroidales bacterium]|nr:hypothetical protein [Bacteroidales bacterium]